MDRYLFEAIYSLAFRASWLDGVILFLSEYLVYFIVLALIIRWRALFPALASGIVARFGLVAILRKLFFRERPFVDDFIPLISHKASPSFPSGHTAFLFAISTTVFMRDKKEGVIFFIASTLVGVSRVAAGVHWPLDIIGGAVVGILSAIIVARVNEYYSKRISN